MSNFFKQWDKEIAHRGPDGEGIHIDGNLGFVHKRLAILDPSENGKQPMQSNDGKWTVVFNGCIYNFKELREELSQKDVNSNQTQTLK